MQNTIFKASLFTLGFWYEYKYDKTDTLNNRHSICELGNDIDLNRLEISISKLVQNNFNLRSVFFEKDDVLFQKTDNSIKGQLYQFESKDEEDHQKIINQNIDFLFDLEKGPLFRFVIIKNIKKNNYTFIAITQHIIMDGTCDIPTYNDLTNIYNNKLVETTQHNDLNIYQNFLDWEKGKISTAKIPNYYNNIDYSYFPVQLSIQKDNPKSNKISDSKVLSFILETSFSDKVITFSKDVNISVFNILMNTWSLLIARYSNKNKSLISYPVSCRGKDYKELRLGLVSMLITLYEEKGSFKEQLKNGSEYVNQIITSNSKYLPFDKAFDSFLSKQLNISGGSDLFRVSFAQSTRTFIPKISKEVKHIPTPNTTSGLMLEYEIIDSEIHFKLSYRTNLYDTYDMEQVIHHFKHLLHSLIEQPDIPTNQLSILDKFEFDKIIYDWNQTHFPYLKTKTIQEVFEEQCLKNPLQKAIVFNNKHLNYKELNTKANQLAYQIKELHKSTDQLLVGLFVERSNDIIIGILGILKAGGAYIPLDIDEPVDRVQKKITECNCKTIITNTLNHHFLNKDIDVIDLTTFNYNQYPSTNISVSTLPQDLAYIIYTSGSTGSPKGVMIEHSSVLNLVAHNLDSYDLINNKNILQYASINFDASVEAIFSSLLTGGTLFICDEQERKSPKLLEKLIIENSINYIDIPAELLPFFQLDKQNDLKVIAIGGSSCDLQSMIKWSKNYQLFNTYGPTEATVCSTSHLFKNGDLHNTIGKSQKNKTHYILNQNLEPVPIGVSGELHIGGDGLARGYINTPNLTDEKFIKNPYQSENDRTINRNSKIYKTGDICKWLPNGDILYIGRIDHQIKIRGYRIELGEIEQTIEEHTQITKAIVLHKKDKEHDYLLAYYNSIAVIPEIELKSFLKNLIPEYMIPSHYIHIDKFPVNINGKIDIKKLPEFKRIISKNLFEPPTTTNEKLISDIWSTLFSQEKISNTDDFFELGGNSITAIKFINILEKKIFIDVPASFIYKHKKLNELAKEINKLQLKLAENNNNNVKNIIKDYNAITKLKDGVGTPIYILIYSFQAPNLYDTFLEKNVLENPIYSIYISENIVDTEIQKKPSLWFVNQLDKYSLHKKVILLGYSYTGVIALETAAFLESKEIETEVILIDTNVYHTHIKRIFPFIKLINLEFSELVINLNYLFNEYKISYYTLKKIINILTFKIKTAFPKSFRKNLQLFFKLKFKELNKDKNSLHLTINKLDVVNFNYSFKGKIYLLKCINLNNYVDAGKNEKYNYLKLLYKQNIRLKYININHHQILDKENAEKTNWLIRELMNEFNN